jgi:predicted RNase H-like HicB family nuclease
MDRIRLDIEKLAEGVFLAVSPDLPGLVVQGRTLQETLDIARDVGERLTKEQMGIAGAPLPAERGLFEDQPGGSLAGFGYRQVARRLKAAGLESRSGAAASHEIWFSPALNRFTTVPKLHGKLAESTLRAILEQAGVSPRTFLRKR